MDKDLFIENWLNDNIHLLSEDRDVVKKRILSTWKLEELMSNT